MDKKILGYFALVPGSKEAVAILLLCILGAVHVFVYSSAFPFFNNVDEPWHFDLVVKYSQGRMPRGMETMSKESAYYMATYNSLAYLAKSNLFPNAKFPSPLWTEPSMEASNNLIYFETLWSKQTNYECAQPPLYYLLTGLEWNVEKRFGLHGADLIYSIRFLNVAFVLALIWLAYVIARSVFPANLFLRMATPALIAFMPQTAFYSINNDILSPVCFGIAFVCLIRLIQTETPSIQLGFALGIALAATLMAKMTNLPLVVVAAIVIAIKFWQLIRAGKFRTVVCFLATAFVSAALPILTWCIWTNHFFGDLTGSRQKIEHLGWTVKPFADWWHHSIFSPHGVWTYLSGQLTTFWQGEFLWHHEPLALPIIDMIYIILSIGLVSVALFNLIPRFASATPIQKQILWTCFASIVALAAFFAFLSIIYDFHNCQNPSREHPYFRAGRMLLGALIPFSLLFTYGLDRLLCLAGVKQIRFIVLAGIILFMLVAEVIIDSPIFRNEFNWFHAQ